MSPPKACKARAASLLDALGWVLLAIPVLLAITGVAVAAELPFAANVAIETGALATRRAVTGDLDGDGSLDVAIASAGDDTIAWYAGDGSGGFGPRQIVTSTAAGARDVAMADLDRDGDLDLVAASADDATVAWYENVAGDGSTWTFHSLTTSAPGACGVFTADLNGDGALDVLAVSADEDRVSWFENPAGPGAFVEHTIDVDPDGAGGLAGFSDGASDIAAADLDGDGALDVVVASSLDDTVAWYRNISGDGLGWTPAAPRFAGVIEAVWCGGNAG